jgi:hypothetical protein
LLSSALPAEIGLSQGLDETILPLFSDQLQDGSLVSAVAPYDYEQHSGLQDVLSYDASSLRDFGDDIEAEIVTRQSGHADSAHNVALGWSSGALDQVNDRTFLIADFFTCDF